MTMLLPTLVCFAHIVHLIPNNLNMNMQMGTSLLNKMLDWTRFGSWKYKITQYFLGQGCWCHIDGALDTMLDLVHVDYVG